MSKRKTTPQFIKESKEKHGNRYDYSLVEYIGVYDKVKIICGKHGIFEQKPTYHLIGHGCPMCGGSDKLTTEQFIKRCKSLNNDKYDYSLVNYINNKYKVKIICKEHGIFEQSPSHHLNGTGCPMCHGTKKKTTEQFIKESIDIHGDRYDYSLTKYKNNSTKVKIICKEHGVFEQNPTSHINGGNCLKCIKQYMDTKYFIEVCNKKHNNKYDYSLVDYIRGDIEVKIICKKHGIFDQKPEYHLIGHGCSICGGSNRLTTEKFIEKSKIIHGDKYDYSSVKYKSAHKKVNIICKKHGIFQQCARDHWIGMGCPLCRDSKGEKLISDIFDENKINYKKQKTFKKCKDKRLLKFDFYLPDYNLCIEYDGIQHFEHIQYWGGEKEFNNIKRRDKIKNEYCQNNNIRLYRIRYDEDINSKIGEIISNL